MLQNQNFICIGNNMWDSNFTNTLVEIMTVLSKTNKVLYVDYEFTLKDVWETLRGRKSAPINKMFGFKDRLNKINTRHNTTVHILTPPCVFPLNGIQSHTLFRRILQINSKIVENEIKNAALKLGMDNPILISGFNPYYGTMLSGNLNEILNIYFCYDEIDAGWHKLHGPRIEEDFIKKTDLVFTTSEYLYNKKMKNHSSCHLIKNGVDFGAFHLHSRNAKEINKGNRKLVGYTGSIDMRFDIDLVKFLISEMPDTDFIFVGRVTNQNAYKELQHFKNVKLVGSRKPEEIPAIVATMDLGIVPYLKNDFTKGVYPLKFNEYLASGIPVVSTDFTSLSEFEGYINFASTKEDFLSMVKSELDNDSIALKERRTNFASGNSWLKRSELFSEIIEASLNQKQSKLIYE